MLTKNTTSIKQKQRLEKGFERQTRHETKKTERIDETNFLNSIF